MSFEEKVEAAKVIYFAALNMAKINIINQTLGQHAVLINITKTQAELKWTRKTQHQL